MRLGRSVAALGAATALVAAGTAVSAPAFAAEEDGFVTNGDYTGVADPNSTLTVSGTGCLDPSGNPTSLMWAIGDAGSAEPAGPAEAAGPTESSEAADASNSSSSSSSSSSSNDSDASTSTSPSTSASASTATSASGSSGTGEVQEDGSWTATIDLARAVPAAGLKDQQRTTLSFACVDYNTSAFKTLGLSLELDSTQLSGTYKLINQSDGSQAIALDVKGFRDSEEVTFRAALENVYNSEAGPAEGDYTALATFTADAQGAVNQTFTPSADLPDGRYKVGVFGASYGEHAWFENILVKDGKMYAVDRGDGKGPQQPTDDETQGTDTETPAASADTDTDTDTGTGTGTSNETPAAGTGNENAQQQNDPAPAAPAAPAPEAKKATESKPAAGSAPAPAKKELAKTGANLGVALIGAGLLASGAIVLASRRKA
ncbi:LPXTG cell wall anchor domain-containing protein [Actinomyces massiliensis]|uniref:LPXTG cell wall anchor domain-containing protein n=1 Tax=Actinomyces massiliensis TaxID=461393 RepID=UPI0028F09BB6|nr:LPXTG cell wall anchor domain-containing protein [Actinomyces massiliensis]